MYPNELLHKRINAYLLGELQHNVKKMYYLNKMTLQESVRLILMWLGYHDNNDVISSVEIK